MSCCYAAHVSPTRLKNLQSHGVDPKCKYSKTCVKRPLSKRQKIGFQDQLLLNAGQKYCKMLQIFNLRNHLSLRSLLCLFLSGSFTQVLLYKLMGKKIQFLHSKSLLIWTNDHDYRDLKPS